MNPSFSRTAYQPQPSPHFDGNTEQIRSIISQVVEATAMQRTGLHDDIEQFKADLERQVDTKIDAAVGKMKLWVLGAVLTQLMAMIPVIFFLGGIYSTNNAALAILEKQQSVLEKRGQWINEREQWEQGVEGFLEPKGFIPPRYRSVPK